ncbi:MAG TPA: T9SS type A sorting domain-containing protein [Chitinophaga sp.]|uniref:T9SS type A sorting domain-containing protein n=1 Tax=Chitinophaga sp. TaxID=1869181 RepID=UPI002CAFB54D|nr:T9SS type A sorting domain-containing protein [Chitinophaga sp.]HVI44278.1 T9SS type A sorting domain-containing protein [Chitinophaga sp.]
MRTISTPIHRLFSLSSLLFFLFPFFSLPGLHAQVKIYATGESHQINGICLGCGVVNANGAIGINEADYSILYTGLSVLGSVEQILSFPHPLSAGKVQISIGTGGQHLSIRLLGGIWVESMLGNTPNGDLKLINASLLTLWQDSSRAVLPFVTSKKYDRIRISLAGGLAGLNSTLYIYYAYQLPMNCAVYPPHPLYYFPFDDNPNDVLKGLEVVSDKPIVYDSGICGRALSTPRNRRDSFASNVVDPPLLSSPKTISFWARLDTAQNPDDPDETVPYVVIRAFHLRILLTNQVRIYLYESSQTILEGDVGEPTTFNHYVIAYDKDHCYFYLNGRGPAIATLEDVDYLNFPDITMSLHNAELDDLVIYDSLLTENDIRAIWCSYGKDPSCPQQITPARRDTVKTRSAEQPFIIYPNPTTGQCNIKGETPVEGAYIEVRDLANRVVFQHWLQSKNFVLPSSLPGGIYYLTLRTKDYRIFRQKLVLTR